MSYSLIISTAASYFNPSSISANATKTGALPKPATQCTATHASGFSWYLFDKWNLFLRQQIERFYFQLTFVSTFQTNHQLLVEVVVCHLRMEDHVQQFLVIQALQLCSLVRIRVQLCWHCFSSVPGWKYEMEIKATN